MDLENQDAQFDVVEQEEVTSQDSMDLDDSSEETITIPKSKFTKIHRKAKAYDATKEKEEPRKNTTSRSEERFERMELKVEGFSDAEVDVLMKNGGKEALKNPYVMAGIESVRTQKKAEAAILGSEGQKSTANSSLSPEAFAKLSSDDQLKMLRDL